MCATAPLASRVCRPADLDTPHQRSLAALPLCLLARPPTHPPTNPATRLRRYGAPPLELIRACLRRGLWQLRGNKDMHIGRL